MSVGLRFLTFAEVYEGLQISDKAARNLNAAGHLQPQGRLSAVPGEGGGAAARAE